MPPYAFLAEKALDYRDIQDKIRAMTKVGVPYTQDMIDNAKDDLETQADPFAAASKFQARYGGKVIQRDFDGEPDRLSEMDRLVPGSFETPLGRKIPIDYEGDVPAIEVRLQEMFGVTVHPVVGLDRMPVRVTLLSPARAPVRRRRETAPWPPHPSSISSSSNRAFRAPADLPRVF